VNDDRCIRFTDLLHQFILSSRSRAHALEIEENIMVLFGSRQSAATRAFIKAILVVLPFSFSAASDTVPEFDYPPASGVSW
jgi:hypothetical protein